MLQPSNDGITREVHPPKLPKRPRKFEASRIPCRRMVMTRRLRSEPMRVDRAGGIAATVASAAMISLRERTMMPTAESGGASSKSSERYLKDSECYSLGRARQFDRHGAPGSDNHVAG